MCESPTHYLIVSKFISDPWGGREGSVNKQVCILKLFFRIKIPFQEYEETCLFTKHDYHHLLGGGDPC